MVAARPASLLPSFGPSCRHCVLTRHWPAIHTHTHIHTRRRRRAVSLRVVSLESRCSSHTSVSHSLPSILCTCVCVCVRRSVFVWVNVKCCCTAAAELERRCVPLHQPPPFSSCQFSLVPRLPLLSPPPLSLSFFSLSSLFLPLLACRSPFGCGLAGTLPLQCRPGSEEGRERPVWGRRAPAHRSGCSSAEAL